MNGSSTVVIPMKLATSVSPSTPSSRKNPWASVAVPCPVLFQTT